MDNVCDLLQKLIDVQSKSRALNLQFFAVANNQANPVVVPTGKAICIMQDNSARKSFRIVNLGVTIVNIFYQNIDGGLVPLSASQLANDGTGGILSDSLWTGAIFAVSLVNPGSIFVTEFI